MIQSFDWMINTFWRGKRHSTVQCRNRCTTSRLPGISSWINSKRPYSRSKYVHESISPLPPNTHTSPTLIVINYSAMCEEQPIGLHESMFIPTIEVGANNRQSQASLCVHMHTLHIAQCELIGSCRCIFSEWWCLSACHTEPRDWWAEGEVGSTDQGLQDHWSICTDRDGTR